MSRPENPEKILVSVIVPVFNCAKYVQAAVESVLCQEVPLELILINDASTDQTEEILEPYIGKSGVTYIKHEKNRGVAVSRNEGVAAAKGKYTAFLDGDDWWEKDKLKKQLDVMIKEEAVLCSTARQLITEEGKPTGRVVQVPEEISYERLLHSNMINCSSAVVLTEALKRFPMECEEIHEDYIAWLRILRYYGRGIGINEPLLNYRVSNKGKSSTKIKSAYMTWAVYRHIGIKLIPSFYYLGCYMWNGLKKYTVGGTKIGK